ncbi:uncharacterized protein LOC116180800 [Photinus pyralis]|uniref:uncharacterized protein LOC116180800 n=1 Tax=Photinus pyralis TaxID=7054 RepID=UPI0012674B44|nr:uncharacterized protein LOC116180800 [Photinus pyralis]
MHRVLFLCSLLGIGYVNMFTLTNFVISTLENCDPNNASEMFLRVTKTSGRQYLDFSINFKSPFDEKIGFTTSISSSADGARYTKLFDIRDKYACKGANKYLGQFWYEIQQAAQYPPGVCPMPKRRYRARNHSLDFSKIALQTFPFGKLRIKILVFENAAPENIFYCITTDLFNVDN